MAVNKKVVPASTTNETGVFGKLLAVIGDSINGNKVEAPLTVDDRVKAGVSDYIGKLKDGTPVPAVQHITDSLQEAYGIKEVVKDDVDLQVQQEKTAKLGNDALAGLVVELQKTATAVVTLQAKGEAAAARAKALEEDNAKTIAEMKQHGFAAFLAAAAKNAAAPAAPANNGQPTAPPDIAV